MATFIDFNINDWSMVSGFYFDFEIRLRKLFFYLKNLEWLGLDPVDSLNTFPK